VKATRLVAIDLDGTLVGSDLRISDEDRAAISRAVAAGVEITITTGRLFSAGRPFADELGLRGALIPLNGAAVFDLRSGAMIRSVPLDPGVALRALDALRERQFRVQLYFGDHLYLDGTDERTAAYIRLARITPVMVPDLRALLTGSAPPEPGPMKLLGIGPEDDVVSQVRRLAADLGPKANVFRSLPQYLEVTDPRADKGTALAWLAAQRGLAPAEVAAIGDSDNDAPMLTWAGRSYAVANATPVAKQAAKRIVDRMGLGVAAALADILSETACERA